MSLPNPEDVIKNPDKVEISKDPATNYAIVGALTEFSRKHYKTAKVLSPLVRYINRLPAAFAAIFYKDVNTVAPMVYSLPECDAWVRKHKALIS
jgi:hypothetical protein